MTINSRRKGKAGELELINLLKDQLGEGLRRNLDQPREGGADVLGLPGWSLEAKRAKTAKLSEWWSQTIAQAQEASEKPVLAYRLDRKSWRFLVALRDLVPGFEGQPVELEWTAEMGLDGFVRWCVRACRNKCSFGNFATIPWLCCSIIWLTVHSYPN